MLEKEFTCAVALTRTLRREITACCAQPVRKTTHAHFEMKGKVKSRGPALVAIPEVPGSTVAVYFDWQGGNGS